MVQTSQVEPKTRSPHFATLLVMALAPQEVGARIRKARLAKGWTHDELARAMGTNSRTVQRWQKGWDPKKGKRLLPRMRTLTELADVLGVPQAYFVETEDEAATLQQVAQSVAGLHDELAEVRRLLLDLRGNPQPDDAEAEPKKRVRQRKPQEG